MSIAGLGNSNRARLLEGLAQSIRERGLNGTTIADIVRLARTSRRTFYECFDDREACFLEMVRTATTLTAAAVADSIDPRASWRDQIRGAIGVYLATLAEDPALTVTIARELPALGERGAALQLEGIERYAELLRAISLDEANRRAGITEISLDAAALLVGGINVLIVRAVDRGEDLRALAPTATGVIEAVLAAS